MSLYVDVTGDRSSPAIVFLHGVGTSGWMWWRQVPAFADYLCLNIDLPGHGQSRDVPWISLSNTASQVADVIRVRSMTGDADVVGLSLGGQVALALLEHQSDVLRRAVVSGVTVEPWPNQWLVTPQAWITTTMLRSRRLVAAQARSLNLPPEVHRVFAENVRAMRSQTYHRVFREVAGYAMPRALSLVRTPALVLAGSESQCLFDEPSRESR